jgi:hypothetical protein
MRLQCKLKTEICGCELLAAANPISVSRRERPRGSRAAEQRNEFATFHYQSFPCFRRKG